MNRRIVIPLAAICMGAPVLAQTVVEYAAPGPARAIPDNNFSGITSSQTIVGGRVITDVDVRLEISGAGARNGDYYVYLQHGTGFAVLLNRVGRTVVNSLGYGDGGLDVTLDDQATQDDGVTPKDVHAYRTITFGNDDTALGGALTDTWAPDARLDNPGTVLDSTERRAGLSVFDGLSSAGEWTLFVADLSVTGTARLESWSLVLTTVPEPADWAVVAGGGLLLWGWQRRLGRRPG